MNINFWLNGVNRHAEISPDTLLIDFLREQGCFSVKRGCETANCGLCTVLMDGRPVLSSVHLQPALRERKSSHWKECRERRRSLEAFWRMKVRNSAVSAIRDLS